MLSNGSIWIGSKLPMYVDQSSTRPFVFFASKVCTVYLRTYQPTYQLTYQLTNLYISLSPSIFPPYRH